MDMASPSAAFMSGLASLRIDPFSDALKKRINLEKITPPYHHGELLFSGDVVQVLTHWTGPSPFGKYLVVKQPSYAGNTVVGSFIGGPLEYLSQGLAIVSDPVLLVSTMTAMLSLHIGIVPFTGDLYQVIGRDENNLVCFLGFNNEHARERNLAYCVSVETQEILSYDIHKLRFIQAASVYTSCICQTIRDKFLEQQKQAAKPKDMPKVESPKSTTVKFTPFDYIQVTSVPETYKQYLRADYFYRIEKTYCDGSILVTGEHGCSVALGHPNGSVSGDRPSYIGYYVPLSSANESVVNLYKQFRQVYVLRGSASLGIDSGSIYQVLYWNGPRPVICPRTKLLVGLSNKVNEQDSEMPELPTWYAMGSEELLEKFAGTIPPGVVKEILITKNRPDDLGMVGEKYPIVCWKGNRPIFRVGNGVRQASNRLMSEDSLYGGSVAQWTPVLPSSGPEPRATPPKPDPAPQTPNFVCGDYIKFYLPSDSKKSCPIGGVILRESVVFDGAYVILSDSSRYIIPRTDITFVKKPDAGLWSYFYKLLGIKVGMDIEYRGEFFRVAALKDAVCEAYQHTGSMAVTTIPIDSGAWTIVPDYRLKERKWVKITGPKDVPNVTVGQEYFVIKERTANEGPMIFCNSHRPYYLDPDPNTPGSVCFPGYVYV